MSSRIDEVVAASGRAWWDRVSRTDEDPFVLDGYGRIAETGGPALFANIAGDVARKLELSPACVLLEAGCGAGAIATRVAPLAGRTVGIDCSSGMLRHAKAVGAPRASWAAADARRLPFSAATFDRVLCYSVFNNFGSDAFAKAVLLELIRVARPGGIVLIGQVPNADRQDAWLAAYQSRFGGAPRSAFRAAAGHLKRSVLNLAEVARAVIGRPPAPTLHQRFYKTEFFQQVVAGVGHHCDVLPAFDLLQQPPGGHPDLRLDVLIRLRRGEEC